MTFKVTLKQEGFYQWALELRDTDKDNQLVKARVFDKKPSSGVLRRVIKEWKEDLGMAD